MASTYSLREMVSQAITRHPASDFKSFSPRFLSALPANTPNTLEPLPANKALHAPASSSAFLARSISGSISKITLSKSLRRRHCLLSAKFRSARELERIEAESDVVKVAAFRAAYACGVETLAFGVTMIRYCFGQSSSGVRTSPMPVAAHRPPVKKKGTSAPKDPGPNSSRPIYAPCHIWFNAFKVTAALDDAPPSPPIAEIRFFKCISAPTHC